MNVDFIVAYAEINATEPSLRPLALGELDESTVNSSQPPIYTLYYEQTTTIVTKAVAGLTTGIYIIVLLLHSTATLFFYKFRKVFENTIHPVLVTDIFCCRH